MPISLLRRERQHQLLLVLLAPVVLPLTLAALLVVLVPVACWNAAVYAVLWVRWKCLGVPIPDPAVEHPHEGAAMTRRGLITTLGESADRTGERPGDVE